MKKCLGLCFLLMSANCYSAGYTSWAIPTRIDVVRHQGILVTGPFGNPSSCTNGGDSFFLSISVTQYKEMYALLVTAIAQGREVEIYTSVCTPLSWYSAPSTTYNTANGDDFTINMR
jgi:NAD(P)H-flavin reductase